MTSITDVLPIVAGLLGSISVCKQAWKAYSTGKTKDVSFQSFVFLVMSSAVWIIYGTLESKILISIGSSIILIPSTYIVIVKIKEKYFSELPVSDAI